MSFTSTYAAFSYADLPLASYRAGEDVLVGGSTTGRLLFLKQGAVAVTRQGTEIAIVDEPGAVFGEVSALLNRPHTADLCPTALAVLCH
jgi:signal-transduction protein with cAMP-binding, CBS, and nucleotidyltransferase domain